MCSSYYIGIDNYAQAIAQICTKLNISYSEQIEMHITEWIIYLNLSDELIKKCSDV